MEFSGREDMLPASTYIYVTAVQRNTTRKCRSVIKQTLAVLLAGKGGGVPENDKYIAGTSHIRTGSVGDQEMNEESSSKNSRRNSVAGASSVETIPMNSVLRSKPRALLCSMEMASLLVLIRDF